MHGGSQPVTGASIQLYAAGTAGYGAGATPLLTGTVFTDNTGSFTLTGNYTCPTSTSQLYLVATGGNPGLAAGTNNPALKLMAALGACGNYNGAYTLNPALFINLNEATTVAAAYALSGFFSADASQVGTSSTNATGLANAFLTAANLVGLPSGKALGRTPANTGTPPQATLNALANTLAACVNSDGSNGACARLFAEATPSGGTAPTDTLQAALNIAHQPAKNVAALYNLASSTPPFQPTLAQAPSDWVLQISYDTNQIDSVSDLTLDPEGNFWYFENGRLLPTGGTLVKFSNNGNPLIPESSGPRFVYPSLLQSDPAGSMWVYDVGSKLYKVSSSGALLLQEPLNVASGLAIDGNGNIWVSSGGINDASLTEFADDGTVLSGTSGFSLGRFPNPSDIAIDSVGNAWVASSSNLGFAKVAPNGTQLLNLPGQPSPMQPSPQTGPAPSSIAIDSSGNLWLNNGTSLFAYNSAGVALSGAAGYSICAPLANFTCEGGTSLALDGAGNLYIDAFYQDVMFNPVDLFSVAALSPTGALLSDAEFAANTGAGGPAQIDSSGNIWQLKQSSVAEAVGAATPATIPLSLAVHNNTIASRP